MQTFIDTATQKVWQFEDDVISASVGGIWSFMANHGALLNVPVTLNPYIIPVPTAAQLLATAKTAQIATLSQAYNAAIQQPVSYMATMFQADEYSQKLLSRSLSPGAVPAGFYWLDANNAQVPMTFVQLQGLAYAMLVQGQAAFGRLQARKTSVANAATVAAAQAVIW